MEELEQKIAELEARLAALEASAHSGHTIDGDALDNIATHVLGRIDDHFRGIFGRRKEAEPTAQHAPNGAEPVAQPVEA